MTSIDRRYKETKGAVDRGARVDALLGRYKERAAAMNRSAEVMGGSTGGGDPMGRYRAAQVAAARGAAKRDRNEVFDLARASLEGREEGGGRA